MNSKDHTVAASSSETITDGHRATPLCGTQLDLDGSDATGTVTFALDGVRYELDLNDENAAEMRSDFMKWTTAARRVGGRAKRGTGAGNEAKQIRDWAAKNGYVVSDRGRIPATVREAYLKSS